MKKLFCLLLAAVLVLGFTACGSQTAGDEAGEAADEGSAEIVATLTINTEGMGSIAYGLEGEDIEFDDDHPAQQAMINLTEPGTYVIKAKPDEGWKFLKWTKDGADFSEDPDITVEVSENAEYIAVFEAE